MAADAADHQSSRPRIMQRGASYPEEFLGVTSLDQVQGAVTRRGAQF